MSDEDAEAHAASIGFNEDQPLMDFEAVQNFYSYRRWLDTHEETWVNQGIYSLTYNYTLDYIQNTLISRSRMIRIGNITTYYHSDSQTYRIKTNDCAIIDMAKNDIESAIRQYENEIYLMLPSKKFYNPNCGFDYDDEDSKKGELIYNLDNRSHKFDYKVSFTRINLSPENNSYVINYFLIVTMNNFILRNNSQWRKKSVRSSAEGFIYFFNDDWFNCNFDFSRYTGTQLYRKRRKRMNRIVQEANVNLYITNKENFETNGSFRILNNPNATQITKLLTN
jgi:hypothetical protein